MKKLILTFFCLMPFLLYGQETTTSYANRWIIKTNVLSLFAQRPTIILERTFGSSFSLEGAYTQGKFNNILFTDNYEYNGFLIRAKKYFVNYDYEMMLPYAGIYAGNLHRLIQTTGQTLDNSAIGFFSYPSRKFSGHSIRSGTSLGLSYFTKSRITLDGQTSVGYGRYLNLDLSDPNTYSKGHPDFQVWLAIGYCF